MQWNCASAWLTMLVLSVYLRAGHGRVFMIEFVIVDQGVSHLVHMVTVTTMIFDCGLPAVHAGMPGAAPAGVCSGAGKVVADVIVPHLNSSPVTLLLKMYSLGAAGAGGGARAVGQ
jgi:hypothetical protein